MRLKQFAVIPLVFALILGVAVANVSYIDQPYMARRVAGMRENIEWQGVIPYVWKPTFGEYAGRTINGYAYFDVVAGPYMLWVLYAYPLDAQAVKVVIGPAQNVVSPLGIVEYGSWNGYEGFKWNEGNTRVFVYATYSIGSTRIEAQLTPNPVFLNRQVTVSGKLYGTIWTVNNGVVYPATITVSPSWATPSSCNTAPDGSFTIALFCSGKGSQNIVVSFLGDGVLSPSSKTLSLSVVEKLETTLTLSKVYVQSGMGLATKFFGVLKEKETGKGVPDKIIQLTVAGRGGGTGTYYLTTNSQGYYELIYANNSGSYEWAEARFNGDSVYLASFSGRIK